MAVLVLRPQANNDGFQNGEAPDSETAYPKIPDRLSDAASIVLEGQNKWFVLFAYH